MTSFGVVTKKVRPVSDLEETQEKGKHAEPPAHEVISAQELESHESVNDEVHTQHTGADASNNSDSSLKSIFAMLKLLRAGQESLRAEMANHTASVAGGLESKEVTTMEKLIHLDIKLADVHKRQR